MNASAAMRRKAGDGRRPPAIARVTPASVLHLALAQAGEETGGLVVQPGDIAHSRATLSSFCAVLPNPALLALVEGPGARYGCAVLDPATLAALVEMLTTGRVGTGPVTPRPPTRTDAMLSADFLDRVLALFETAAQEADLAIAPVISGFRYALPLEDARAVGLALEEVSYRLFTCALDLGRGARKGEFMLLLPWDPPVQTATGQGNAVGWSEALEAAVSGARAELRAVIARPRMALGDVAALEPGALLPLAPDALGAIRVEDISGRVVGTGKLGQSGGMRAVRLADTAPEDRNDGAASTVLPPRAPVPDPEPDPSPDAAPDPGADRDPGTDPASAA